MIEIITFTGIDARTDLAEVKSLAHEYPWAEFGVLIGSHTGKEDLGIFPPLDVAKALGDMEIMSALHLCGKWARTVAGEDSTAADRTYIYELSHAFDRVQVNLHGDEINSSMVNVRERHIRHFANYTDASRVILQHRGEWMDIPTCHPKVEYLFDLSEGRGLASFSEWPDPPENGSRVGYAGGLGPHNIQKAIEFAETNANAPIWFDMEGRIRTDGHFDLAKVRSVCEQIEPQMVLCHTPSYS